MQETIVDARNVLTMSRLFLLVLLTSLAYAAHAQKQEQNTTDASRSILPFVVPLRYEPPLLQSPLILLSVNGKPAQYFIVDTGAGRPLYLTQEYAETLGLKPTGKTLQLNRSAQVAEYQIDSLWIVGKSGKSAAVKAKMTAVTIPGTFNTAIPSNITVVGVIGLPFFASVLTEFDWSAQQLTLYPPHAVKAISAGASAFPLTTTPSGVLVIPYHPSTGKKVMMMLDTGSYATWLPSPILSSLTSSISRTTMIGMLHGVFLSQEVLVPEFRLGEQTVRNVAIGEQMNNLLPVNEGVLGMNLLSRFTVTLDASNKTVYLKPNKDKKFDFQFGTLGIELTDADGRVSVLRVTPGSPAEKSPIKKGDIVRSLNGVSTAGQWYADVQTLMDGKAGAIARLTLERPDHTQYAINLKRTDRYARRSSAHHWDAGLSARWLAGKPLDVIAVRPHTPLAQAGVKAGDQVIAIDGKQTLAIPIGDLYEIWHKTHVILQVVREGTAKPLHLVVSDSVPQRTRTETP